MSFGLGTAALSGLGAPRLIWLLTLAVAVVLASWALLQHRKVGNDEQIRREGKKALRQGQQTPAASARAGVVASLEALRIPGPSSPHTHLISFQTANNRVRHVGTQGKPRALRFVVPTELEVRDEDLPAGLACGAGTLIVKRFTETGIALEERGTAGDDVQAEVYF